MATLDLLPIMSYHEEIAQIKKYYKEKQPKVCLQLIENLADDGSTVAALVYGDMLMTSIWDVDRIETELAQDSKLFSPTDFPKSQYLLLPRDPVKAVEYYKKAAELSHDNSRSKAGEMALARLAYCKTKGYAGLLKCDPETFKSKVKLDDSVKQFLDKNARNASRDVSDIESSDFVSLPDILPHVLHPKTGIFRQMAKAVNARIKWLLLLFHALTSLSFFYTNLNHALLFNALIIALFTLPLLIFMFINYTYGYKEGRPICSCDQLQAAHELALRNVPEEGAKAKEKRNKQSKSPFAVGSAFIRNSHKIKNAIYWFMTLVSTLYIAFVIVFYNQEIHKIINQLISHKDIGIVFYVLLPIHVFIFASSVTLLDKDQTKLVSGDKDNGLMIVLMNLILSLFIADCDCKNAYDHYKQRNTLDNFINRLEK